MFSETTTLTKAEFRSHIRHFEILETEARHAVEDALFRKKKGRIHIAVDSSEVHSLIFPKDSSDELKLFADDTPEQSFFLHRHALDYLFFRRPEKLLILPPHALELQSFVVRLRSGLLAESVRQVIHARKELEAALDSSEARRLQELARSIDNVTPEDLDRAIEFFEQNVGSLMALADSRSVEPLRIVNRLISEDRFMNIDVIPPSERNDSALIGSDFRQLWTDRLIAIRGADRAPSCLIDGIAMATIRRANQRLRSRNEKIHFVTRSPRMHQIFDEQFARRMWDDAGGHIMRHPRQYTGVFGWEHEQPEDVIDRIERRQSSLRFFVNSAHLRLKESDQEWASGFGGNSRLWQEIQSVKSQWHLSSTRESQALASLALREHSDEQPEKRSEMARVLLRIFIGHTPVSDLFQKRIGDIVNNLDRQQQLVAWLLQTDRPDERKDILERIWIAHHAGRTELKSLKLTMPYTLRFEAAELQEWSRSLGSNGEVSWDEVVTVFREGFRSDEDHERLLAMAFLLGMTGSWQMAEECCELAKSVCDRRSIVSPETLFFLAACKRNQSESPQRYQEAIDLLEKARRQYREFNSGNEDARYIREQATQIIHWNRDRRRAKDPAWQLIDPPPPSTGLQLLQESLRWADDPRLLISIRNGISYYYCEDAEDPMSLRDNYEALVALLESEFAKPADWPPLVADTVVWSRYKLRFDTEELTRGYNLLVDALSKHELRVKDRETLSAHRDEIAGYIQNSAMAATRSSIANTVSTSS